MKLKIDIFLIILILVKNCKFYKKLSKFYLKIVLIGNLIFTFSSLILFEPIDRHHNQKCKKYSKNGHILNPQTSKYLSAGIKQAKVT
jgi:hypothetical protein